MLDSNDPNFASLIQELPTEQERYDALQQAIVGTNPNLETICSVINSDLLPTASNRIEAFKLIFKQNRGTSQIITTVLLDVEADLEIQLPIHWDSLKGLFKTIVDIPDVAARHINRILDNEKTLEDLVFLQTIIFHANTEIENINKVFDHAQSLLDAGNLARANIILKDIANSAYVETRHLDRLLQIAQNLFAVGQWREAKGIIETVSGNEQTTAEQLDKVIELSQRLPDSLQKRITIMNVASHPQATLEHFDLIRQTLQNFGSRDKGPILAAMCSNSEITEEYLQEILNDAVGLLMLDKKRVLEAATLYPKLTSSHIEWIFNQTEDLGTTQRVEVLARIGRHPNLNIHELDKLLDLANNFGVKEKILLLKAVADNPLVVEEQLNRILGYIQTLSTRTQEQRDGIGKILANVIQNSKLDATYINLIYRQYLNTPEFFSKEIETQIYAFAAKNENATREQLDFIVANTDQNKLSTGDRLRFTWAIEKHPNAVEQHRKFIKRDVQMEFQYWPEIPPEVQAYIVSLTSPQDIRNMRNVDRTTRKNLDDYSGSIYNYVLARTSKQDQLTVAKNLLNLPYINLQGIIKATKDNFTNHGQKARLFSSIIRHPQCTAEHLAQIIPEISEKQFPDIRHRARLIAEALENPQLTSKQLDELLPFIDSVHFPNAQRRVRLLVRIIKHPNITEQHFDKHFNNILSNSLQGLADPEKSKILATYGSNIKTPLRHLDRVVTEANNLESLRHKAMVYAAVGSNPRMADRHSETIFENLNTNIFSEENKFPILVALGENIQVQKYLTRIIELSGPQHLQNVDHQAQVLAALAGNSKLDGYINDFLDQGKSLPDSKNRTRVFTAITDNISANTNHLLRMVSFIQQEKDLLGRKDRIQVLLSIMKHSRANNEILKSILPLVNDHYLPYPEDQRRFLTDIIKHPAITMNEQRIVLDKVDQHNIPRTRYIVPLISDVMNSTDVTYQQMIKAISLVTLNVLSTSVNKILNDIINNVGNLQNSDERRNVLETTINKVIHVAIPNDRTKTLLAAIKHPDSTAKHLEIALHLINVKNFPNHINRNQLLDSVISKVKILNNPDQQTQIFTAAINHPDLMVGHLNIILSFIDTKHFPNQNHRTQLITSLIDRAKKLPNTNHRTQLLKDIISHQDATINHLNVIIPFINGTSFPNSDDRAQLLNDLINKAPSLNNVDHRIQILTDVINHQDSAVEHLNTILPLINVHHFSNQAHRIQLLTSVMAKAQNFNNPTHRLQIFTGIINHQDSTLDHLNAILPLIDAQNFPNQNHRIQLLTHVIAKAQNLGDVNHRAKILTDVINHPDLTLHQLNSILPLITVHNFPDEQQRAGLLSEIASCPIAGAQHILNIEQHLNTINNVGAKNTVYKGLTDHQIRRDHNARYPGINMVIIDLAPNGGNISSNALGFTKGAGISRDMGRRLGLYNGNLADGTHVYLSVTKHMINQVGGGLLGRYEANIRSFENNHPLQHPPIQDGHAATFVVQADTGLNTTRKEGRTSKPLRTAGATLRFGS